MLDIIKRNLTTTANKAIQPPPELVPTLKPKPAVNASALAPRTSGRVITTPARYIAYSQAADYLRGLPPPTVEEHAAAYGNIACAAFERAIFASMKISVITAFRTDNKGAIEAYKREIVNIISNGVMTPVLQKDCTVKPTYMGWGCKLKYNSTGEPIGFKARGSAGGNLTPQLSIQETSSPTVQLSRINMTCQQVQVEGRYMGVIDFVSAYFNAKLLREINVVIDPNMAKLFVELYPSFNKLIRSDGSFPIRVHMALYGLHVVYCGITPSQKI